jgi:hypothetical protein
MEDEREQVVSPRSATGSASARSSYAISSFMKWSVPAEVR